ncbi:uncharacterized protein LOC122002620 isoform X1 [Zingiber officinale]|uniref:uncharacterized protein LOC122002620 isoform X1 n=1 Tax=Zingiber officinale TaxID=94328 RepID=UPI001C4BD596|nr:uncharacterized protein LOC122002620 isoform X1 [Zingiber officinale]XP_042413783.1 uncharacterized protein LOC122002620 isoform X1 [Zingiber officinale]
MEDGDDISPGGDLPQGEEKLMDGEDYIEEEDNVIVEGEPRKELSSSYRIKIIEILRNLHSPEIKIYSDASRKFISLLRGEVGGGILREYIQLSPQCSEIVEAWRIHQGKPGMVHILSLVSVIFNHSEGKSQTNGLGRNLDKFAWLIIDTKMSDIYAELDCNESRRQMTALDLLASIVRRGGRYASEVAKNFDFKLQVLFKISGLQKKGREERHGLRRSIRRAFVGFLMSFIEVGNPRLVKRVLQQGELYSAVLRGLASDETETITYVITTLQNKVLSEDSLVPPSLRSVIFGSIALEQLCHISGNSMAGRAAELAHEILVTACTDPCNGLMPGLKMKGNVKRLLELMRKLKATEVGCHRDLLLAISTKSQSLAAAYMDAFPYNVEPRPLPSWFTAVSVAADVISSVDTEASALSLANAVENLPSTVSDQLQNIFKNIIPRVCNRSLVNKGLLHADILVKHGSLRLIMESLKSLKVLVTTVDNALKNHLHEKTVNSHGKEIVELHGPPGFSCFLRVDKFVDDGALSPDNVGTTKWMSLRQRILDEIRGSLPDPQVLLKLLSSLSYKHSAKHSKSLKRTNTMAEVSGKRLKSNITIENDDIVIGGINISPLAELVKYENEVNHEVTISELGRDKDPKAIVAEIWKLNKENLVTSEEVDEQDYFYARLLDVIALYMWILPSAFEGSFDFFKILPSNILSLPIAQQQSLLYLLVESIGQSPGSSASARIPDFMYKHLQPLINLLIYSPSKEIKDLAYILAKSSLISTGAFDQNISEVDAWMISLPGFSRASYSSVDNKRAEAFRSLYSVVISFLCDAVSTVGNSLYKYLDQMHKLISNLEIFHDDSPGFSPLIICIFQKCLRLLESDTGTFKLYERSVVSLYVSNTLKLILESQVDMKILPGLINSILNEKFVDDSKNSLCEWRPLKNLFHFSQDLLNQKGFTLYSMPEITTEGLDSFQFIHSKMKELADRQQDEVAFALLSSIICAPVEDLLKNLHFLFTIAPLQFNSLVQFLSYLLFIEPKFLVEAINLWPSMFLSCQNKIEDVMAAHDCKGDCSHSLFIDDYLAGITLFSDAAVSKNSVASALSSFLRHAPFCALVSSFVCLGSYGKYSIRMLEIVHSPLFIDLLKDKIAKGSIDDLVLFLGCVLFWAHHIRLFYKAEPSDVLEELFQVCFTLVECIFEHILADSSAAVKSFDVEGSSLTKNIIDAVQLFLNHPLISWSISDPICYSKDVGNDKLLDATKSFDSLVIYSKQNFHKMDSLVLQRLTKVFENFLSLMSRDQRSSQSHVFVESVLEVCRGLIQKTAFLFREKFDVCVDRSCMIGLLPHFYIFYSMMNFCSPFDVLELANWMFSKIDTRASSCSSEVLVSLHFCMYIADSALDLLYSYMKQRNGAPESYGFHRVDEKSFNVAILQKVYCNIIDLVLCFNMKTATTCLLKAVYIVYNQKSSYVHPTSLPLYMLFSRMISHSPMNLVICCLNSISKVKGMILSLLMEVSPLFMHLFGQIFLGILSKSTSVCDFLNLDGEWSQRTKVVNRNCNFWLSEDDFILLLPAALSYVTSHLKDLRSNEILIFYSKILLENFSNWKSYVSGIILMEKSSPDYLLTSSEHFDRYLNNSLLGTALTMLHYFFTSNGNLVGKKQRLQIFNSLYSNSFELLDDNLKELSSCSYEESLKIIIDIFAKISFTRMLLSPVETLSQCVESETRASGEKTQKKDSERLNRAKLRFMTILVSSLDQIVSIFPLKNGSYSNSCVPVSYSIHCYMEHYILKNIIELAIEMRNYLSQIPSVPSLDHFIRSCLLYRFEDPATLKAIRCFLAALPEKTFSSSEILGLLLGHSKFVSTILSSESFADSSASMANEQSLPSVLKFLDVSTNVHESAKFMVKRSSDRDQRRLELIKLVRVLYHFELRTCNVKPEISVRDSRELFILLLSSYGATLSKTDLEILSLIHEIESIEGTKYDKIAEMDYLWGNSVLKIRKEVVHDGQSSLAMTSYCELAEDQRKMLFRENMPVDMINCVMTVLNLCHDGSQLTTSVSIENLLQDKFIDVIEQPTSCDSILGYDPAFILRFSLHCLVIGFIEPIEFSQLGLLAVAFVSISSVDEELRKLGYEVLGRYKLSLENSRNKDLLQLQLLLTYFQNGITQPWERVPSIFTIFAAEASFMLIDNRQNHFFTISRFLMHSPKMDFKSVPLFHTTFKSTDSNKLEHIWILQLLYAGINSIDDAKIYRRNKLLEFLLSFHASSMSNSQSSFLILQIIQKSTKLPMLAEYMVKECGLLSWLFSVITYFGEKLHAEERQFSLTVMELILKAVNDVVSITSISEWLQDCALEQLSELSSYLHHLFVNDIKLLKENVSLVRLILHVVISTFNISQKRAINQPKFTISLEGLFNLYLSINTEFSKTECAMANELGLTAMLMSSPLPVVSTLDKARLVKLTGWAISASLQSSSSKGCLFKEFYPPFLVAHKVKQEDEPLISKLLRWVVASVILGTISNEFYNKKTDFCFGLSSCTTLESALEFFTTREGNIGEEELFASEALAFTILYLQQLLGRSCMDLPSVIFSLCLLLISEGSSKTGKDYLDENHSQIVSLCSKIRCPLEVHPAWRWSFAQPWRDDAASNRTEIEKVSNRTEIEKIEEEQACQSLLIIFSTALNGKQSGFPVLSHEDLERSGLFQWERDIASRMRE